MGHAELVERLDTTKPVLSVAEESALSRNEAKIERGLQTFYEVGNALAEIRDDRLYRENYATFEEYCQERWGMSRPRAYQFIDAADVRGRLSTIVDKLPANESQVRPLTQLAPNEQVAAWQRAVETAPNGKVTAAHVASVVEEMRAPPPIDPLFDPAPRPSDYWADDDPIEDDALPFDEAPAVPSRETEPTDSDNWYTPPWLIESARAVLGCIDLDPASCDAAQEVVQAQSYYTEATDGLAHAWRGCLWLNPPYSAPLPWIQRLIDTHAAGAVEAAVVLVNTANTPQWARLIWHADYPVCLLNKRVGFWRPSGATKGGDRDQMIILVCRSDDMERRELFREVFGAYGAIR